MYRTFTLVYRYVSKCCFDYETIHYVRTQYAPIIYYYYYYVVVSRRNTDAHLMPIMH